MEGLTHCVHRGRPGDALLPQGVGGSNSPRAPAKPAGHGASVEFGIKGR